jgi:hypothetical protein
VCDGCDAHFLRWTGLHFRFRTVRAAPKVNLVFRSWMVSVEGEIRLWRWHELCRHVEPMEWRRPTPLSDSRNISGSGSQLHKAPHTRQVMKGGTERDYSSAPVSPASTPPPSRYVCGSSAGKCSSNHHPSIFSRFIARLSRKRSVSGANSSLFISFIDTVKPR